MHSETLLIKSAHLSRILLLLPLLFLLQGIVCNIVCQFLRIILDLKNFKIIKAINLAKFGTVFVKTLILYEYTHCLHKN